VRQAEPEPMPPDPTSPGVDLAPEVPGAGDRADHGLLEEARQRRQR
jgi:hypothetical protein